jgi:predicted dehydrogenase
MRGWLAFAAGTSYSLAAMGAPLKIVVVGCGGISNQWFKALQSAADVSVVGIVDLREEAAAKRKAEHGLKSARVGTDVEAMLRDVQPDVVCDCTVPEARETVVLAALRHGCHVLSEKPMAASMEQAAHLIEAAARTKRLFAVMQNRRFDPRIRALRAFLASGALGEVTTVNSDFYLGAHFGGFRDQMPHVLLIDMAIHTFDQARLISGADPVAVYCHEWNPRGSWYDRDASAVALFEMSNGVVFTYRGSWCAEGRNTTWECDWRVVASRGSVTWDGADSFRAEAVARDEGGLTRPMNALTVPVSPTAIQLDQLHAACIHDFLDCVCTGRVPETVCTENVKSLAMVFGAIRSAESKQRVVLG